MSKYFVSIFLLIGTFCVLTTTQIYPKAIVATPTMAFVVGQKDSTELSKLDAQMLHAKELFTEKKTEKALKLYLEILELAKAQNNIPVLIEVNFQISEILKAIKSYNKALYYSRNSLKHALIQNDTLAIIEQFIGLGVIHFKLYSTDSISNSQSLDSLYFFNNKAFQTINNNVKYQKQKGKIHSSLAVAAILRKNYLIGEKETHKALSIDVELKDTIGQIINLNTLAGNYLKTKNYQKAVTYYNKSLALIEGKNANERKTKLKRMLYSNLAWTHYNLKEYIAYEYLAKANRISDSLRNAEFDAIITEIEAKHNVDIIKQHAEKKHLIEVQKKERFQVWTLILTISLVLGIIAFWVFSLNNKLKHQNKDLMLTQATLVKEKEIEVIESENQIKILNATIDGKEAERKQIAETLHDSVSALLSAANLHLQASKTQYKGTIPIEINKTQDIIEEASNKIRHLSHDLISSVLLKFGLSFAIQDFCEKYSNSQLEITCLENRLQRYDESFEIKINNIIEELINNMIKHSKARQGYVSVKEIENQLHVKILDDGEGFDSKNIPVSDGIGIHQIEARIKMMKGVFKLNSQVNEGTKINFIVPIKYRS